MSLSIAGRAKPGKSVICIALRPSHEADGQVSRHASASASQGAYPASDPATAWWERSRAAARSPC
eukprot:900019-Pleurochrysis_carterae.AAC.1